MTHDAHDNDRDLERLATEARRLPELAPARDLWPGIEARLDGVPAQAQSPASSAPPAVHAVRRSPLTRRAMGLAAAAAVLIAVTATVTWQMVHQGQASAVASDDDIAPTDDTAAEVQLASFTNSVESMQGEVAALERIVAERRADLDPRTAKILEDNLRLIDRAIAESRAALAADPGSAFLSAQFARAYTSKITLLRDVATLPVGL